MERIGVRELRQNASHYLRRVGEGESFVVADRGRPVAVLVPVHPTGRSRLLAEGRIRPGEGDVLGLGGPLPLPPGVDTPSVVLARMREE